MIFSEKYDFYLTRFENALNITLNNLDSSQPKIITDAIKYAIINGGKRIRPILCYASSEMLGVDLNVVDKFAVAIEMIHSYSLVHDDLPSMDNDDYRRGKLSTHKKFGESYGILAGDALLNLAFETCLSSDLTVNEVKALSIIAKNAGYTGMIAGQVLDLKNENNSFLDEKLLYEMYEKKTSKLLTAPLLVSSCLADGLYYDELNDFGYNLGLMFQISDDILDETSDLKTLGKSVKKDSEQGKYTSVRLFGLDGALKKVDEYYNKAKNSISKLSNNEFLLSLLEKIYNRKS